MAQGREIDILASTMVSFCQEAGSDAEAGRIYHCRSPFVVNFMGTALEVKKHNQVVFSSDCLTIRDTEAPNIDTGSGFGGFLKGALIAGAKNLEASEHKIVWSAVMGVRRL